VKLLFWLLGSECNEKGNVGFKPFLLGFSAACRIPEEHGLATELRQDYNARQLAKEP